MYKKENKQNNLRCYAIFNAQLKGAEYSTAHKTKILKTRYLCFGINTFTKSERSHDLSSLGFV